MVNSNKLVQRSLLAHMYSNCLLATIYLIHTAIFSIEAINNKHQIVGSAKCFLALIALLFVISPLKSAILVFMDADT
jgi:hypothetical protein